jgi:hypothetical protein
MLFQVTRIECFSGIHCAKPDDDKSGKVSVVRFANFCGTPTSTGLGTGASDDGNNRRRVRTAGILRTMDTERATRAAGTERERASAVRLAREEEPECGVTGHSITRHYIHFRVAKPSFKELF